MTTIANLVPYMKRLAEKLNIFIISPPLTNQHAITLFLQFSMKKVEYRADWSEQTNQLTIKTGSHNITCTRRDMPHHME